MSKTKLGNINPKIWWRRYETNLTWLWFRRAITLVVFSLVVNHLASPDSFLFSRSYKFPVEGFLSTIVLCILIGIIADINFKYYKKKHFSKKVEYIAIIRFMASTLGYITLMYIPVNIIINVIAGVKTDFYFLLAGLLISLLICFILIGLLYAVDIYKLHSLSLKDSEITIESGAKVKKLTYKDIACFYLENKVVYTIQNDGKEIITNFTLNELEERTNNQLFFRANRKTIIHKDAVDQIEKIENGKLTVSLKVCKDKEAISKINISRYKRKEFLDWID